MKKKITRIGVGGPVGSGKTAIVEAITPRLLEMGIKVLIITNDVVTTEDAKHVQRTLKGILLEERILGVETGACPHTAVREDPSMNLAAVEDMEARFPDGDVVLIESGGDNLTLTFSPALVDFFIYVIDVAAGDKIPRKNGPGITQSDILVINKTDLAPHVGASLEVMEHDSRLMRGDKPFLFTNCKTGEGIPALVELIRSDLLFDLKLPAKQPRDAHRRGRADSRPVGRGRDARPDGGGVRGVPGRAAADGERRGRQDRLSAPRLRAPRRPHDPGRSRPPRAVHGAARAVPRPGDARPGLALHDHDVGLRAAGRPARARGRARAAGARARDDAVGDQGPRHGRQLRGADAVDHARRRRLPRVPARAAHPAPARPLPERHADLDRPDGDAALRGDRPAGAQAPPSGRVLRRDAALAGGRRGSGPTGGRSSPRSS